MKSMYTISFGLIFLIFLNAYYLSYNEIIGDQWAYQELFINYSAGFIKEVLPIFIEMNNFFEIEPLKFFTIIFILIYSLYIFLCFKVFKKISNYKIFYLFIILSPSFILFYIYDLNTFLTKDIFTNLSVALHAFYIIKNFQRFNIINYNKFLTYFLIPILLLNILNHEFNFFISIHILFTLTVYKRYNLKSKIIKFSIIF